MDDHDPYAEGCDAFMAGASETDNPYPAGSDDAMSWQDGWSAMDEGDDDE